MELMIPRKEVEVFKDLFEKAFKAADPESTPFPHHRTGRIADIQQTSRSWVPSGEVRKYRPILMLLFGTRTSPLFTWVSTDSRSFVTRDKDEKRAKKVAADSIMGKVLIALSSANLLDPEMMFSEGKLQPSLPE